MYLNFQSSFTYKHASDLSAPHPSSTLCLGMLGLERSKPYFGFPSWLYIRLNEPGILDGDSKAGEGRRNAFLAGRLLAVPKSFTLLYTSFPQEQLLLSAAQAPSSLQSLRPLQARCTPPGGAGPRPRVLPLQSGFPACGSFCPNSASVN